MDFVEFISSEWNLFHQKVWDYGYNGFTHIHTYPDLADI